VLVVVINYLLHNLGNFILVRVRALNFKKKLQIRESKNLAVLNIDCLFLQKKL